MVSNPQLEEELEKLLANNDNCQEDGKDGNDMQVPRGLSQNKMQAKKMKHMMTEDTWMKGREKWHYNLDREQQL